MEMVRSMVFSVLAAVVICSSAAAKGRSFGFGIILGEPTGLCFKKWATGSSAVDGAVAWSLGDKDALHLHADYLVHNFGLFKLEEGQVPLYYGIGGRIKFEDESKIGIRIPVGLDYNFANAPLDIFIEIVPLLDLVPSTDFNLNGAIGLRYLF